MVFFFIYFLLPLLIFCIIYGLAIFGLVKILSRMGVSSKKNIVISFFVFGIFIGFLILYTWHYDVVVLVSIFTVFLGDYVYQTSIQFLGNPNSAQAHYSIPWILRIPQVYVPVSIIFWSLMGGLIQYVYNRRT